MPGLLTLTTDLKSLKYGADRPGGGSSEQPYIVNDINNPTNVLGFDDGLVRGGAVGAAQSGATDTIRIGKFFLNNPLFIVKQVGLQFSNPRLEVPKDPANILMGGLDNILAVGTNGFLEPTRTYNLGVNTIAQVPVNAFGAHFNRHGLLPIQTNASKYEAVATANNESHNRLVKLTTKFNLGTNTSSNVKPKSNLLGGLIGLLNSVTGLNIPNVFQNKELIIDQYLGGPGSAYGIGGTIINRTSFTDDADKINKAFNRSKEATPLNITNTTEPELRNGSLLGVSKYASTIFTSGYFLSSTDAILSSSENTPISIKDRISVDHIIEDYDLSSAKAGQQNINGIPETPKWFSKLSDITGSIYNSATWSIDNSPYNINSGYQKNTANNADKQVIHPLSNNTVNSNDIAYSGIGPSSYPGVDTGSFKYTLNLPNTIYGSYSTVNNAVNALSSPNNLGIYASIITNGGINPNNGSGQEILPTGPNSKLRPTYTNGYGEQYIVKKFWDEATREIRVGSGRQDSINLTPIFKDKLGSIDDKVTINGKEHNIRDLVKFRIQAIDTDKPAEKPDWMIFRAYITDYSDNVDAEWTDVKYAGRGDKFYIYNGFSRKMSVSFKVAALSSGEMKPMYQKLNFLMSNLMPDYSGGIVMRGPMMRMTIGNWIDGQLCVLNSLSYKIPNDSPWEIAIDEPEGGSSSKMLILPHVVEVTLNFTPIGSLTKGVDELSQKEDCISNIAQNWNGKTATEANYIDGDCATIPAPPKPVTPPAPPTPPTPLPIPSPVVQPVVFKPANDTPYRTTQAAGVTPGQLDQRLLINQFKKKK
jgi:hypothetical protein